MTELYQDLLALSQADRQAALRLRREAHVQYLSLGLTGLPAGYVKLNASRPWICYWLLHSLALLDGPLLPSCTQAGTCRSCMKLCSNLIPHCWT